MKKQEFSSKLTETDAANWQPITSHFKSSPTALDKIEDILSQVFQDYTVKARWSQDTNAYVEATVTNVKGFPQLFMQDQSEVESGSKALSLILSQYANLVLISNVDFSEFKQKLAKANYKYNSDFSNWDTNLINDLTTKLEENGFNIVDRDWLLEPYTYSEPYYQGKTLMDRLFGYT